MKKFLALTLAVAISASMFVGCGQKQEPAPEPAPAETTETPAEPEAPAETTEESSEAPSTKPYIAVISKGFQHQFWQTVMSGSEDAANEFGVEITFEGPPSESDISLQVDMLNAVLAKNPAALCLAALDTSAVVSQLEQAKAAGIPVVGFDSGVPDAPEGSIVSTASTDNYAAGGLAADEMFNNPIINEKIKNSTADNPVVIAVQSQDATSESIIGRTQGFLDKMEKHVQSAGKGIEITGHDKYNKMGSNDSSVTLAVTVQPSTNATDGQASAQAMLQNSKNLIGYYCSNAGAVDGLLAATADGTALDRANGQYKDLIVVGFDAGANQKNAVKNQYFYGAVTQDPYKIGYLAVKLAYNALQGEKVEEVVDTGCKFYTHENMDSADIAPLLYD